MGNSIMTVQSGTDHNFPKDSYRANRGLPPFIPLFVAGSILILTGILATQINGLLNRQASSAVTSISGRYLMENVPVDGALVAFEDLAYLRITDKAFSKTVFRSPLYSQQSLDMRSYEDDATVGIVWIDFLKRDQSFSIRVPDWKERWLNSFISNTPYEVVEDD